VTVTFEQSGNTGVTTMGLLKISSLGFTASASSANRKEQLAKQREYLKKKKAKKAERYKNMEKEREQEKNKWQNFSTKAFGKKGFVKKSIFKTPENATGRVGIGTCGVGGAEMTKFTGSTKHYKK
jgi:survival-of-motor-neuron-related-splicing factor 30